MRRSLVALIAGWLVLSLAGPTAQAEEPYHERYENRWVNVFWHSRERVDRDTYLLITWYVGAYESSEYFFSDLYRSVDRCQVQDGRDRCRTQRDKSWYGYTSRRGAAFELDRTLTSSHLDATYKLYRSVDREEIPVGRFDIVTDVAGVGDLAHGRSTYTVHQGCTTISYSGTYRYREATATGTLTREGGRPRSLGETDDASLGENQSVEFEHTC